MPYNDIANTIAQFKETIGLVLTGIGGGITYIAHKYIKGEQISLYKRISYLIVSGFAGYITGLICSYFGIEGDILYIMIGMASYSGTQIMGAIDMIKAKVIYNLFIDFIKFKLGGKH